MGASFEQALHGIQYQCTFLHRFHTILFDVGWQAKLPIDIVYGNPFPESLSIGQYVTDLRKSLQEAYQNVRVRTNAVTQRQKELYDQKAHGDIIEAGDLVWPHNPAVP